MLVLFLILLFLVLLAFTTTENIYGIVAVIIGAVVLLQFFSDFHPIDSWYLPLWIVLYLIVGAGYSIYKWYNFCNAEWKKLDIEIAKKDFEEHKDFYQDYSKFLSFVYHLPPLAVDNRDKIETWIVAWPLSIVIDLFCDPIKLIYDRLLTTYDQIGKSTAGGRDI